MKIIEAWELNQALAGASDFDASQLAPSLIKLGVAIGVLRAVPGETVSYELNADWFQNPLKQTGDNLSKNGATIAALLAELLGEVSAGALGIPAQDLGTMGVWYPIANPSTKRPSGFYLVNYPSDAAKPDGDQVFGIGILHQWTFQAQTGGDGAAGINVRAWGLLPVLRIGQSGLSLVLGQQDYPLNMGVEFAAADKQSIIDSNGFSFNGVKFSGQLDVLGEPKVQLSVVVLQLKLPTEVVATDRNLSEIAQITPQEWLSTVSTLFVTALERVLGQDSRASNILPIFGLSPIVPGSDVRLPMLRWDALLSQARSGAPIYTPFVNWFNELLGADAAFPAWMGAIASLLGISAPQVAGSGTQADPYLVALMRDAGFGTLSLTMVTQVDAQGTRYLLPGFHFGGKGQQLGTAPAQLLVQAQLDLAQFSLSTSGQAGISTQFLNLNLGITLTNTTAGQPLFQGSVGGANYVFGSVHAGVSVLQSATAVMKVVPAFQLNGVTTPTGKYEQIDLTQPGQLVDQTMDELYRLVDLALQAVFGLAGNSVYGRQAAIILGVISPDAGEGQGWPTTLPPPFSARQLVASFQNPVSALSAYYSGLVQPANRIGEQLPVYYLLQAVASLLNSVTGSEAAVTGAGAEADPWLFKLTGDSLPASLLAYLDDADGGATRLMLGLQLSPVIAFGAQNTLDVQISVHALSLLLAAPDQPSLPAATIFPGVAVRLGLPQTFTTPAVAGAAVSIAGTAFTGNWSTYDGWRWNLAVGQPAVIVDGASLPVGQSMLLSDSDSLAQLVTKQAATFAPIVVALCGVAVYRTGNRPGLALNALLGLLPNLKAFVPSGIAWPDNMPVLRPTGFSDPVGDIKRQLSALLASADCTEAVMALIGWSVANNAAVPSVTGKGSYATPYAVPVALPGGFALAVWASHQGQALGLGLQRAFPFSLAAVHANTELLLRLIEVPLTGPASPENDLPGLRLQTRLTPETPLPVVSNIASGQLLSILFGLELGLDNDMPGTLVLQPLVQLTVKDDAGEHIYDLQQLQNQDSQWVAAFYAILNLAVDKLVTPLLSNSAVKNAYQLLALMHLTVPPEQANFRAAIDAAGWSAMLAGPLDFFKQCGTALFADSSTRPQAIAVLQAITGISLPPVPLPMLQVLHAFQLVESQDKGYAPRLSDWVDMAAHPVQQLQLRFGNLIRDPARLAQLIGELSTQNASVTLGPIQLAVSQGAVLRVSVIEDKAPMLGNLLRITGALNVDLRTFQLAGDLDLYCAQLQMSVRAALAVTVAAQTATGFGVKLCWGDGSQPMPPALTLYPFAAQEFLQQATELAPNFALATFFTQVIDARLLNNYALARTAMTALGLAFEQEGGRWYTKSPLGLFDDPVGWLLGDAVLGANGHLNIGALQRVLATVTGKTQAANGVGVMPISNGARIFGLPYGQQIDLVADAAAQIFTITPGLPSGTGLPLTNGVELQALSFSLSLGSNFQPGLAGSVALSGKLSASTTLVVNGGYDKGFRLSAGQLESKQTFQVLPFPGWQTLVLQAVQQAAQALLKTLTTVLLDQLAKAGAADFVASLRSAGTALQVPQLVTALIAVTDKGADAVGDEALKWLTGRLASSQAAATVQAVATVLSPYLAGIKTDAGLLKYTPSASLPVTLATGVQTLSGTLQVGLWLELRLPAGSSIVLNVEPTGVGIPVQSNGMPVDGFKPQLNFQLSVLAPLQDDCGPKLAMRFDGQHMAFVLGVDPAGTASADSSYYRELLPTFFGESDPAQWGDAVLGWLESILLNIVPRYLSIVVLNQGTVSRWLAQPLFPGNKGPSAAQIMLASQLVVQQSAGKKLYMLNSFSVLANLTLEQFLAGFLRALLAQEFQLVSIGKKGGIWLGPRSSGGDYFGLRVMVPDVQLAAVPYVTFQLGDESTEWISKAGGSADLKGGVSLYVPISTSAPDFGRLVLDLVNIGLDFHGKEGQNLVQTSRFALRAVQPRGLISFDFEKSNPVQSFGGGVTLNSIGISLAPNTSVSGKKVNPVAQNLLGSGSSDSSQSNNPAANPGFSVRTSYVDKLYVELFSDDGSSQTQLWFPVQRSFGPLYANKVGVGWEQKDYLLDMLFDGNVSMAGLFIGLNELSVGVPVKTPLDYSAYTLDLAGLEVGFSGGAVEISGGFLKRDNPLRYDGSVAVKMAKFGLTALGSYALVPVDPNLPDGDKAASLFVFANLNIPLGPIPEFFITGVAAGFAYNRNLRLPEVGEINTFPLVQGAVDSSVFGGGKATPESALAVLSEVVYPQIGQYWVAGGIQFSTYQLLNTFALLVVRFGREFAIDLIGVSSASFPPKMPPAKSLAYVELGLLLSFHPGDGVVSARAQLTTNSFVLSQDCRLTGGFAATYWYKGERGGDFVVTLGGYNPAFKVPDYYPAVPRLGFNWPMSISVGSLNIDGGAYFALTPSAIMAGGYLQVLFAVGPLRAWFDAGVDFLIQWQPFYFRLNGHVSVGAGFETTIAGVKILLSAQIGARLILWGPPIAGEVSVDWFVISFTIPFGNSNQAKPGTQPLSWDGFQQNFLPPLQTDHARLPSAASPKTHPQLRMLAAQAPQLTQDYAVLKMQVEQGLLEDYPDLGWVIQLPFVLNINTVIPSTKLQFGGSSATFNGADIGIQPMAQPTVTTPLTVTLQGWDVATQQWTTVDLDARKIQVGALQSSSPEALWSKHAFDPNGIPQAKTIPDTILGAALQGSQVLLYAPVGPMALATLAFVTLGPLPLPYAWTPHYPPQAPGSQRNRAQVIAATIMDPVTVVPLRNAMLSVLRSFGQPALDNPSLTVLQHNVGNIYLSPPSLAPLGMDLTSVVSQAVRIAQPRAAAAVRAGDEAESATEVLGSSRRYRVGSSVQPLGKAGNVLPITRYRTRSKWVEGAPAATVKAQGQVQLQLTPGTTSIIRLGSKSPRTVQLTGNLPLRLCAFNQYQEPLMQLLADPAQSLQHAVPAETQQLAVFAGGGDAGVLGWYDDSEWTRLNHYYFQGESCLIRPEAAPLPGKHKRGQILASEVLKSNQVRAGDDSLLQGWLETLFLDAVNTIAVIVRGDGMPRVQLCWTDDLAHAAYGTHNDAMALQVQQVGDVHVYLYSVPARGDAGHDLAVLVRDSKDGAASVRGVLGFADDSGLLKTQGLCGVMQCDAGVPANAAPPSCQLLIA